MGGPDSDESNGRCRYYSSTFGQVRQTAVETDKKLSEKLFKMSVWYSRNMEARNMPLACSDLSLTFLDYRRYPYLVLDMTEEILQPIIAAWASYLWLHVFQEEQIGIRHDPKQQG